MVVYYSRTGNTMLYAHILAEMTNQKLVVLMESLSYTPFMFFMMCKFKIGAKLMELPNIENEKEITLCSPVWAGGLQPHCIDFVKRSNFEGKKVNLILTCGMDKQEKALQNVIKFLKSRNIDVGATMIQKVLLSPKPTDEEIKAQLTQFLKKGE